MVRVLEPEKLTLKEAFPDKVSLRTHILIELLIQHRENGHAISEIDIDPCQVGREQVRIEH